jgi:hypothetical protein
VEQLVAAQPEHADDPAERDTVSPPLPLDKNPQADMSLQISLLLHEGQSGCSDPKTKHSKVFPHASHLYS